MIPLAVSGPLVIGVSVLFAIVLIVWFLKLEEEGEALELAEEEAESAAAGSAEPPPGTAP
jgi:hypothetical protein